jgi:hypothetical protein
MERTGSRDVRSGEHPGPFDPVAKTRDGKITYRKFRFYCNRKIIAKKTRFYRLAMQRTQRVRKGDLGLVATGEGDPIHRSGFTGGLCPKSVRSLRALAQNSITIRNMVWKPTGLF